MRANLLKLLWLRVVELEHHELQFDQLQFGKIEFICITLRNHLKSSDVA